jgi:hypothetical protein
MDATARTRTSALDTIAGAATTVRRGCSLGLRRALLGLIVSFAVVVLPVNVASAEVVVIGGPGQLQQPAIVPLVASGAYGARDLVPHQFCTLYASGPGTIQSATYFAFRSPRYDAYRQQISLDVRVDTLTGTTWTPLAWASTQTRSADPGQYPRFDTRSFAVTPTHWYRLVYVLTWRVNGVVVGQTYDTVNGDAIAINGAIKTTGSNPGACYFPR